MLNSRLFTAQARQAFSRTSQRSRFTNNSDKSGARGRRWQSSTAQDPAAAAGAQASFFKRMWDSPVGVKTVHFWAPVMKWSLVIAGISDFARPVEKLSLTQNAALTATGAIWTRWCFIIKPKNMLLAAVNFFLGTVGAIQVTRILMWQRDHKADGAVVAGTLEEGKETLKKVEGRIVDGAEKVKEKVT